MTVSALDTGTALIVIDLQRGLAERDLAPFAFSDVVANVAALSDAFHAADLPVVIVTVDDVPPGRTDLSGPRAAFPDGWSDAVSPFADDARALRVTKQTPGAFTATGLHESLQERGVTQVVVVGVSTSVGVEMTVRQAFELGYNVTVALDGCSDSEGTRHEYSATAVLPRVAETGLSADVLAELARRA
ncbi:isochorismatase family protein [Gordonia neofelifaecis]|uniref:Hydrolase n=1 Tax=Gordonia neofelifaecis NRRL B-59395 TaxID=644548 RepID=F1YKA4_9ACTN|nr:isochorismatase family protein [Gordonia neofelifaecis]EGD54790.1 hydrolase [Gordonia neofelifaecis NRRL B-59395]